MAQYKRILLKISGEALMGQTTNSVDPDTVEYIIQSIKELLLDDIKVGLVLGGGNFFRGIAGSEQLGIKRVNADYMGMVATIINGILFKDVLHLHQINAELYSPFELNPMVKTYNHQQALLALDNNWVVVFVGGTGSPLFTTDSAAALRAIELDFDLLIKATKVDGIYDQDPKKFKDAKKYSSLTYDQAIHQNLQVMDTTAFALCKENHMKINVCNIFKPGVLKKIANGENEGTWVE